MKHFCAFTSTSANFPLGFGCGDDILGEPVHPSTVHNHNVVVIVVALAAAAKVVDGGRFELPRVAIGLSETSELRS